MSFRRSTLLHLALIIIPGLLVYINTLEAPFVFDDILNVQGNPLIRKLSNIPSLFAGGTGPFASRPLMHATFALNYYFGGLDTSGYHAVNIALHLLNGALLYFLMTMTGKLLKYDDESARPVALLASLIFVVHPVHTDAVTYVVSRSMLLATMFYLSGIMLFAKAATAERRWPYVAGLFVVSLLGAASREDFITFPLMLLLYDLFFISGFRAREISRRWRLYIAVIPACAYLVYLALNNTYVSTADSPGRGVPPLQYALTQLNVHWTYLRLLVLPIGQNADYDYPTAKTLLELPTALSFVGYLGLWAGAVMLARKRPVVSFGVLWFLVAFLPISFLLSIVGAVLGLRLEDVIFEHRLYLPSVGVIAVFSALAVSAAGRLREAWTKRTVAVLLVIALAVLSVAAHKRNEVWKTEIIFWSDVLRKAPGNIRAHNNIAFQYFNEGRIDKAVGHFEAALRLDPDDPDTYNNIGALYASTGQYEKAIEYFQRAVRIDPKHAEAYFNLGLAYMDRGLVDKAIENFDLSARLNPQDNIVHENLGMAYLEKGMTEEARRHFGIAESLRQGKGGP